MGRIACDAGPIGVQVIGVVVVLVVTLLFIVYVTRQCAIFALQGVWRAGAVPKLNIIQGLPGLASQE